MKTSVVIAGVAAEFEPSTPRIQVYSVTSQPTFSFILTFFLSFLQCTTFACQFEGTIEQWHSTFFVRLPPDVICLQLCTPKVIGAYFKLHCMIYIQNQLNK
jgi:hypothetical protein